MLEALPLFAKMTSEQLQKTVLEFAMAGQHGLDLKDPTPGHTLKAFPIAFRGMKIVSYMYAAFQQFMPGVEVDIERVSKHKLDDSGNEERKTQKPRPPLS